MGLVLSESYFPLYTPNLHVFWEFELEKPSGVTH